jgi:hypothetical protein
MLGALLLKADANRLHDPDRHLLDVAFLTSLATDPSGCATSSAARTRDDSGRRTLISPTSTIARGGHWVASASVPPRATWRLLVDGA